MLHKIVAQIAFSASFPYLATVLGVTTIVGIRGWSYWKRKQAYKSLSTFSSPPKHWLLENLPQVLAAVKQKKYFQMNRPILVDDGDRRFT